MAVIVLVRPPERLAKLMVKEALIGLSSDEKKEAERLKKELARTIKKKGD